ncbi:uncharacterized protein LOC110753336 [Prunus avium]|uniref:Uncharacterized protein LOC110753336 n=1 Tax=Prunus avium TaxID=42229 RepID=A0A6P5S5P1_PRUAV|nr:uncharacterized protein LOC110753336 [Prunus avium]
MEVKAFCSSVRGAPLRGRRENYASSFSPLLIQSMATQKPIPSVNKTVSSKKNSTKPPVKLLTRVEQLKLLTKAEKAGLLSAAEKSGLSLSSIEKLGLLSKAEEFGVLSAATDPGTPGTLFTLSLALLLLGPFVVYLVPEDYPFEIGVQAFVALLSVVGGSAAFAASNFVSNLQKSN